MTAIIYVKSQIKLITTNHSSFFWDVITMSLLCIVTVPTGLKLVKPCVLNAQNKKKKKDSS